MKEVEFQFADSSEEAAIKKLLKEMGLPHEDITCPLSNFIIAKSGGVVVGVVGLEVLGSAGLLRSLAVARPWQDKGLANALYASISAHARLKGVKELYLLTTTAEGFFSRLGFCKVERKNVPEPVQATNEFQSLCPSTAICMVKRIDKGAQYYPKDILRLETDVPGVRMWGVALDKTMMTFFEVKPNSCFEMHSHLSEQITMVLEGELFFEIAEVVIHVKEGEVIAIPSNLPHAAFTCERSAKAVDAWSPVMERYKK